MKKVLYVLNDCMRKFSYERAAGLRRALQRDGEPFCLYILRSDAYYDYAAEHNLGEYNIFRLPDYDSFDGILLDINSIFSSDGGETETNGVQDAIRASAASGRPVISMANHIPGFRYAGIDNHDAMDSVIRHLHMGHGLTDFWFVLGPADNYESKERERGLRDYCAEHHLPCGEDRFYAESFIIECGIHAFGELMARHGGRLPQAVICANDHIAYGVGLAAEAAGFHIPGDFRVCGFDNADLSVSASPPITTVDQQSWNMGDACVSALRKIWNGEAVPEFIRTPVKLILRESTECVPCAKTDLPQNTMDYIGSSSSSTDFSHKMGALQYRLPGCKTIEEICDAMIECVSVLNCDGFDLVLDSRLQDMDRILSFRDESGQVREITSGLPSRGYSDTLELVCHWEKGKKPDFSRRRFSGKIASNQFSAPGSNYLFCPLHFQEYSVGFLRVRNGLDLMRINGVSTLISTLTMALRSFFAARSLSYINHVLSGISMKDGLTGLYNRLGYHELAYPLFRRLEEERRPLAIVFFDMDRLKHINDVFGHSAGDQAIRCIAEAIRKNLPESAIPVRYGGDEFLALMPEGDAEAIRAMLRRITADLSAQAKAMALPETPGISTGFVVAEPDGSKSLDEYVQEADRLMYLEKKAKKAERR